MGKLNKKFNQKKPTSYKTMLKRTAQRSGYHLYEVEDVLEAYSFNLRDALINHEVVELHQVGKLGSRVVAAREFKSALTGEITQVSEKAKFLFVPSVLVKQSTNANIPKSKDNPSDSLDYLDEETDD